VIARVVLPEDESQGGRLPDVGSQRYPEDTSPMRAKLEERYQRFAELREDFLADYRYNTARAYWGDLDHLNDWCMERGLDILALSEQDLKKYLAWMRRRGSSGSTVRRRPGDLPVIPREHQTHRTSDGNHKVSRSVLCAPLFAVPASPGFHGPLYHRRPHVGTACLGVNRSEPLRDNTRGEVLVSWLSKILGAAAGSDREPPESRNDPDLAELQRGLQLI
jgi:Phage integrase, N-terminal SAM-like domain